MLLLLVFWTLIFIVGILIYRNARLAVSKCRNPYVWGIVSLLAFFISYAFLGSIYLSSIYKGATNKEAVSAYLMNEPLSMMMMLMLGIGGMLLVRIILERSKPRGGTDMPA